MTFDPIALAKQVEEGERGKIRAADAIKEEEIRVRNEREDRAQARLKQLLEEFDPLIERTQQPYPSGGFPTNRLGLPYGVQKTSVKFRNGDLRRQLAIYIYHDSEQFTYFGHIGRDDRPHSPNHYSSIDRWEEDERAPIKTHDYDEFRRWLAQFLGLYIARFSAE